MVKKPTLTGMVVLLDEGGRSTVKPGDTMVAHWEQGFRAVVGTGDMQATSRAVFCLCMLITP